MIKNIKEEVDVDRVIRGNNNHRREKFYSSVTCHIFPYTEEGYSRVYDAQAARERDGPHGRGTGQETVPGISSSLSTNGIPGSNISHGRGQN